MGASEFLIVICSPRSAQSQWVNREVAWFKTHRDPSKILAIIVDGEPMSSLIPGREAEECFPKTLLYKVGADLQPTEEAEDAPLAADARETGDGKRGAKLKLAAAMLSVGYDALQRRDDRRRAQRRRFAMSAMAASIALLGGLTIFAFNQRNAAIVARNDAEFQRDEAQSLVEFMLTDLRQRLDAVGRLDILDAVAERLNESYAKQDLAKLDADALGRRARVQLLLGEVDNTRGDLDAALAQYKEAAAATEELLRRDPDNEQRIFDHAQSVYWVGDIALRRGDMATVTDYWTQYRDFGSRLVELNPNKDEWRTELAYGYRNLASLALDEGDANEAVAGFQHAIDISREMVSQKPTDRTRLLVFADDNAWLALAFERLGEFENATVALEVESDAHRALLRLDKADDYVLNRQAVNGRVKARLAMASGDIKTALTGLIRLAPIHLQRLAVEPDNTLWLQNYTLLQLETCQARLARRESETAYQLAKDAVLTAERLIALDSTASVWIFDYWGEAALLAGRSALAAGDVVAASAYADRVRETAEKISNKVDQARLNKLFGKSLILSAIVASQNGDGAATKTFATAALVKFEKQKPRFGFQSRTDLLEGLILAGEIARARSLSNELDSFGYRHPRFLELKSELSSIVVAD